MEFDKKFLELYKISMLPAHQMELVYVGYLIGSNQITAEEIRDSLQNIREFNDE